MISGDTAILTEGLGKRYRIGLAEARPDSLHQAIVQAAGAPFRYLRTRLRHAADEETFWALKDLSIQVKVGEVLGVIGRNGAGKSTLLKILSRITDPSEGRAWVRGQVNSLLEVGTGFHPELTGRENIFMNAALHGMKRKDINRKMDEIIAFAEVEKFLDTPVKRYSSGMYVRLAFAVAAHLEPQILLVDEVLAVGDAAFRKKCLGKMDDVAGSGRTVLFVSHDMSVVQNLCHRCLWLANGRVRMDGPTSEVVEAYLSEAMQDTGARTGDAARRTRELGQRIRLTGCDVLGAAGSPKRVLQFGEPFSVRMEAEAYEDLEGLTFVIGLETRTARRIGTTASEESGMMYTARKGERLSVTASFPGVVPVPGTYRLTIGIRSGGVGYDQVEGAATFDVSELAYEGVHPHLGTWGDVRLPAQWTERLQ